MKSIPCIRCQKSLTPCFDDGRPITASTSLDGGSSFSILGGWGSKMDTGKFLGALCDECFDEGVVRRVEA